MTRERRSSPGSRIFEVKCGPETHRIYRHTNGQIRLLDHDLQAERALRALGGGRDPTCLRTLQALREGRYLMDLPARIGHYANDRKVLRNHLLRGQPYPVWGSWPTIDPNDATGIHARPKARWEAIIRGLVVQAARARHVEGAYNLLIDFGGAAPNPYAVRVTYGWYRRVYLRGLATVPVDGTHTLVTDCRGKKGQYYKLSLWQKGRAARSVVYNRDTGTAEDYPGDL